jgi:hypothetical protein
MKITFNSSEVQSPTMRALDVPLGRFFRHHDLEVSLFVDLLRVAQGAIRFDGHYDACPFLVPSECLKDATSWNRVELLPKDFSVTLGG